MRMPPNYDDSAKLLASVFESAIDGIIVIDQRGVIQMANEAVARLFGYEIEALVGKNVSVLMADDHARQHDGYISRYLRTGEARIIGIGREVEGRRQDGSLFPFRLSVGELSLLDNTLFSGIVHDRSAEHTYEQELAELNASLEKRVNDRTLALEEALQRLRDEIAERRKAELEAEESRLQALSALERERQLGELKSRFVSMASHEFRTPLSTILSSAELIRRYTEAEQQDRRTRHIDRIRKSVVHLTDILNDFLSLGKMDEGNLTAQVAPIELQSLVDEFVDYIRPAIKPGQRIELHTELSAAAFLSDARLLRNILNNLVSNASKYSDATATIRLDVTRAANEDALEIVVADEGIGIPEAEQGRLFERFFRARNAENLQGTGLGLHIVSRYLQMLGGSIAFESEVGTGTTFTVRIPEA